MQLYKKSVLKSIANKLETTCYKVESEINGHSRIEARSWAKSNSIRHARTVMDILEYSRQHSWKHLKILNASGISSGHQDFSIAKYLREDKNLEFDWISYESPRSEFLQHHLFEAMVKSLNIELRLSEFNADGLIYGKETGYDIVLFTEIAEHLELSTFLKTLQVLNKKIKPGGYLILTTPNLLSFWNRRQILFGNGDFPFWGDGSANMEYGLYGHIVNYDIKRLKRILSDVGFQVITSYTFTYVQKRYRQTIKHWLSSLLLDYLCEKGINLGTTIYIKAVSSNARVEIPMRI